MHLFSFDASLRNGGYSRIAGIDEAGRGCIAGPVVSAAVVLPSDMIIEGLKDSKKLSSVERERLFAEIFLLAEDIGIGMAGVSCIERMNVYEATRYSMKEAVRSLSIKPDLLLIDAMNIDIPVRQMSLIKGEDRSASIAAASIVAKVVRDRIMEIYDIMYPNYNFRRHKGYCTGEHMKRLLKYGPCPIHRRTFRHVMDLRLPFFDNDGVML